MKMGKLAQLLLLLALARGAQAAEPTTGFYLGASAGHGVHDVDNGGALGAILVGFGGIGVMQVPRASLETEDGGTGWRGLAGYRFSRYLAAELEYLDFSTSEIHETYEVVFDFGPVPQVILIDQDFKTDVSGPAISALGKLPVGERFELFVRAGVLFADSKVRMEQRTQPSSITYSDRVLIGGVGVDWAFGERWSVRLEYQRSKDIEPNLDIGESHVELLSLGVLLRL
jgi:opacity protein-like surface antigen